MVENGVNSDFSHQLRTPMTVLRWYSKSLLDEEYGKLAPEQKEAVNDVYQGTLRQIKLIGSFLDVAHIESGKIDLVKEKGNIENIVQEVIKELKVFADKAKLSLKFEKSKKPIPEFMFDQEKIREITRNLVDNAIKYTQKGGIKVKTAFDPQKKLVTVSVQDTGMGFNPEEEELLFAKFSRLKSGKSNPWGSGLGLYVCKRLIETHGGGIEACSKGRGKGSEFKFWVPVE